MGKNGELLRSLEDNNHCGEGEELFKVTVVSGTPFNLMEKGGKVCIRIGPNAASNTEFESTEEAMKYIEEKPWELLSNLTCLMAQALMKLMEKEK